MLSFGFAKKRVELAAYSGSNEHFLAVTNRHACTNKVWQVFMHINLLCCDDDLRGVETSSKGISHLFKQFFLLERKQMQMRIMMTAGLTRHAFSSSC